MFVYRLRLLHILQAVLEPRTGKLLSRSVPQSPPSPKCRGIGVFGVGLAAPDRDVFTTAYRRVGVFEGDGRQAVFQMCYPMGIIHLAY